MSSLSSVPHGKPAADGKIFFISPLLYHQSILDYKYRYIDSRK